MSSAIAVFDGPKIKGYVTFIEGKVWTTVTLNLSGLKKKSQHGFHVHECGQYYVPSSHGSK